MSGVDSPAVELYLPEFVTLLDTIAAPKPLRLVARGIFARRPLLLVARHREALAPLATPRVEHAPSALGLHPRAEPVCPKTALTMWLIGPLHNNDPKQ